MKWSGAFTLLGAVVLTYAWETSRRRRAGNSIPGAFGRAFVRETFGMFLAFAIVPAVVFVAVWLPWLHHFHWEWGKWWEPARPSTITGTI